VLGQNEGVLTPKVKLDPPHYDGVQSLAMRGGTLFSGSRDSCIKKWDLSKPELVQVSGSLRPSFIKDLRREGHISLLKIVNVLCKISTWNFFVPPFAAKSIATRHKARNQT